jgi:inactivated superfamily I helicase
MTPTTNPKDIPNMSEKQIGMELQKTVKALEKAKEIAIENMAQTIGLAADAGDILLSARQEGLDIEAIQEVAGNKR